MTKKIFLLFVIFLVTFSALACAKKVDQPKTQVKVEGKVIVKTGLERIDEFKQLFADKRIGLITNATGIDSQFNDSASILAEKVNLVAVFSPEHGYLGQVTAGKDVGTYIDERLGIPVFSLYGPTKKPTEQMLENIDMLVFDIQDIGVRNYTYLSTMAYAMEAAAHYKKQFVVLDRPNPLSGKMEGPVLKKGFESFIGLYPIPYRHGLTAGESALLYNQEFGIKADLTVIPMTGWARDMYFEDTGLPWVMTSPNIPTLDSVMGYAMTGFYSGINVTNGVGTTRPFELVGGTWIDAHKLVYLLNKEDMAGLHFRPIAFQPRFGALMDKTCYGMQLHFVEKRKMNAVESGARIYYILRQMSGVDKVNLNQSNRIDKNLGENSIWDNESMEETFQRWRNECNDFAKLAAPYLLYK